MILGMQGKKAEAQRNRRKDERRRSRIAFMKGTMTIFDSVRRETSLGTDRRNHEPFDSKRNADSRRRQRAGLGAGQERCEHDADPTSDVSGTDCSNYMLPQLKNLGDSLVVQDGDKAVLTGLQA